MATGPRERAWLAGTGALLILTAGLFGWWIAVNGAPGFDRPAIGALAGLRGHADIWLAVTTLGDGWLRIPVMIVFAGWLLMQSGRRDALILIAATGGEMLGNSALKQFFARARPDLLAHLDPVTSYSYPSGHAAHSAALYLLIALLLASGKGRPFAVGAAVVLIGAIGVSRIVLGVHWPSDVIGGWAVGLGFALIGWSLRSSHRLHH